MNLTLRILGKRSDGYHELDSLVAFADEADVLTLDPTQPVGLTVRGPMAGLLTGAAADDGANLVTRAIAAALVASPGLIAGHITLDKHLPVAAGIGGGSADAGATLRLLRRANPGATLDWMQLAAPLGADVTVCFADTAAVMTGIGETLTPLGRPLGLPVLLVNPMVAVPANKTAAVFKALAAQPLAKRPQPTIWPRDVRAAIATSANDLEAPAMRVMPVIGDVLAALRALEGCRLARLSGAGPTCFALFDTTEAAAAAKNTLSAAHGQWWIRATRLT